MAEHPDFVAQQVASMPAGILEGRRYTEPNTEFYHKYQQVFREGIMKVAGFIPPETPVTTIEVEGKTGVLPDPAKRVVVREALVGQPLSPLRVSEEEIIKGKPERIVQVANIHVITEINALTAADAEEINAMLDTLLSVRQSISRNNVVFYSMDAGEPAVRVMKFQAKLHMIERGIVGNYDFLSLPLNSQADLEKAISAYSQEIAESLSFVPLGSPSEDYIPHDVFNRFIAGEIAMDRIHPIIHLPVAVAPKDYRSPTGLNSYMQSSIDTAVPGQTLIMVPKGSYQPSLMRDRDLRFDLRLR